MKEINKGQQQILKKLGIKELNPMQKEAYKSISSNNEVILLSATGSGKTVAFLLPILARINPKCSDTQVLILVPSRELAIQIEQVIREMGSGFKVNAVYGGRSGFKDRLDLKHSPTILIGTPGRIADHFRRETIATDSINTLVLDEFDKSLEVGFEKEMKEIIRALPSLKNKILTSATQGVSIPSFMNLSAPCKINYLREAVSRLTLKIIESPTQNKLKTLAQLINQIGNGNGIIFCNFKDTIQTVSEYLYNKDISHSCFYGGLEQLDRERSLIKFRNGTHRLLVATDLAARGIDVPEMDFIIHYELPLKQDEFTHRNGRTARMNSEGTAYILKLKEKALPPFIKNATIYQLQSATKLHLSKWETLYITGGRKDSISKGDIAGLFFKQGNLLKNELGIIELKQDCAYVAVPHLKAIELINKLNNSKLKKKKVRISLLN